MMRINSANVQANLGEHALPVAPKKALGLDLISNELIGLAARERVTKVS
jgi:hypothetical protein